MMADGTRDKGPFHGIQYDPSTKKLSSNSLILVTFPVGCAVTSLCPLSFLLLKYSSSNKIRCGETEIPRRIIFHSQAVKEEKALD